MALQIDIGAGGGPNDPVYHYHSNYDSYHWMATFGDPGFKTHVAMGQFLGLMAYHLATDKVIPFDVTNYPKQLNIYLDDLKGLLKKSNVKLNLSKLEQAIRTLTQAAELLNAIKKFGEYTNDSHLLNMVNHKQRDLERAFVTQGGLPNREFYKHVIFAPGLDTGYVS